MQKNKYIFMPIFNVDGVAYIEKNWVEKKMILAKRKNMNVNYGCQGNFEVLRDVEVGVDLNRNFGIDFG